MIDDPNERSSVHTWNGQASRWVLAAAIAGSALAVGTVHSTTLCIVTGALGIAAALGWWRAEPIRVRPVATLLLVTGFVLTGYTALQCVPVPVAWLAAIAPHNADVWSRALMPLREPGPRWAPISLDPVATRLQVLTGVAYLLAFVTALRVARRRDGVAFLSGVIVATGVALAAAALLHPAFKLRRLFGMYEPGPEIGDRHIAPLMNPNNLAGYLNVALCLALAATVAPQPRRPRAIMGAVVLLLGATQVWVASRGGVVTMFLGALVVLAIAGSSRSSRGGGVRLLTLVAGLGTAVGTVLIVVGSSEEASGELLETNMSKLAMFARVMRMLPSAALLGCGRGAFESAFPAFRADVGYMRYTHPENVVAQWVLEWGVPIGVAGLAAVAFALRPTAVMSRSSTAAGAWAALVALFVQNLGDLGTEIPGLMIAAVVCAAIVVAGTHGREPKWRVEQWPRVPSRVALGSCAAAALAIGLALTALGRELRDDRRAAYDAALDRRVSSEEMHARTRAAMLRHPAEPYLPFITAARAAQERDDNAIPWIGATLERARVYAPAHLVLARVVAPQSPSQARLEYRLAMEQAPEFGLPAEASRVVGGYFDAMELVPSGSGGARVIELLIDVLKDRLPATCARLDVELSARAPTAPGPALRAGRNAAEDVEVEDFAPWCRDAARVSCLTLALEKSTLALQLAPGRCDGHALHARARIASGDVEGGLMELETAVDRVSERVDCLKELARISFRLHQEVRVQGALDRIANAGCTDNAECARNLRWAAQEQESHGNIQKALALYRRARMRTPDDDSLLEQVARLSSAAGLHVEAAENYEQLARRHPQEARWKKAAAAERDSAIREAVKL
jgi:tetratricopeptide (TPR) repeat protein